MLIGNGGAEYGVRGYLSAYDAATGKLVWRFYTVPGNPKDGFENPELEAAAKTWNGEWWVGGGGGTVWDSMAYDPDLDTLYVGTGNGSPWARDIRSPGGGDNLFLSSILAMNPDTGRLKWHYQVTPADNWDYTATQHIILADLAIDGKPRKVLMQAPKNGFFYVLDRETGELISADKYAPVTWASRVDLADRPAGRDARGELQPRDPADRAGAVRRPQLAADGLQPGHRPRLHPRDAADGHLHAVRGVQGDGEVSAPRHVLERRHRLEHLDRHRGRPHEEARRAPAAGSRLPQGLGPAAEEDGVGDRAPGVLERRTAYDRAATCSSRAPATGSSSPMRRTPARSSGPCPP